MSLKLCPAKYCNNGGKNLFKVILTPVSGLGKSPCFSELAFLSVVGPDYPMPILPFVYGTDFLECAL